MVREFKFPDVGEGIAEGEIVRWLIQEGDRVNEHQDLVEVETDKAVVTLPSPYPGKVLQLHGKEHDVVKVGDVLVTIEEEKQEATAKTAARKDAGSVVGALEEAEEEPEEEPSIRAIPAVRALAKDLGVDLNEVRGTGPGGRILKEDVERAAGKAESPARQETDSFGTVEKIPFRGLRRRIAQHVEEARRRIADVTIWEDADITDLEKLRAKHKKAAAAKGINLTYLPFLIKAVIPSLKAHAYLNASLDDEHDAIILKKYYNIGIAVDTPGGLMVFVIKKAEQKTILELAQEIGSLADKARHRVIDLADLKGSTFTITNYGVIGASYGTPIINYPEVAILGLGKIQDQPVARDGKIVIRRVMPLSLAFDHRVIDGVEAARFLNDVIHHLEDPEAL